MAQKCLKSWQEFAPGVHVKRWDSKIEELCNNNSAALPRFAFGAFKAGKWAMLSDWVRMKALYEEGGTYFDFDVELVKPFDNLPQGEWIASEWIPSGISWLNPGCGIRLSRHSEVAKFMLQEYDKLEFDPSMDMMPWINEKLKKVTSNLNILPPFVLSPIDLKGKIEISEKTIAVHHYQMSWATPQRKILQWMSWHGLRWLVDFGVKVKRFFKGAK